MSTVFLDVSERPDLQECLNEFVVWADRWQLQVAEHKCFVLTIVYITPTTYHLKCVQLLSVNENRDLGVIVDDKCLLSLTHINHVSVQCWNTVLRH